MPADDIDQLISLLLETGRKIRTSKKDESFSPYTALRIEALRFIADAKSPTMRDVAESFCITPPSATALVGGLVKSGAVVRVTDPADRRVTRLAITPAGKKALAAGSSEMASHMRSVFGRLSPTDRQSLSQIFAKLSSTYHE